MQSPHEIPKTGLAETRKRPRDRACSRIIEYGILGLLIFTPLPAASVYPWTVLVIEIVVLIMAVAYVLMKDKPRPNERLMLSAKKLKPFFIGFLIFLALQTTPLPKALVRFLSPGTSEYLRQFALDFPTMKWISFSLIPSYTLQRGLEVMTYLLLGFLILRNVTKMRQVIRIFEVLIVIGVAETLYGMIELYDKSPRILFYKKAHNLDSVTGTFVNRNHFSGYLEMVVPLAIGLIIARAGLFSRTALTLRERIVRLSEQRNAQSLLLFGAPVIMAVGIIFSRSRSGVFILVFSFILFFGPTSSYLGIYKFKKKWVRRFLQGSFLFVVSISLYVGIDATLQRFSLDSLLKEGRPTYWANTLTTFTRFPLTGTGLGTFGALYPTMEGETGPLSVEHAHNDYLEYLSELGLAGFGLVFGGILVMALTSLLVWRTRRNPEVRGLALGGIVAIAGILIHSLTDFNLQSPANLALFSVVLPLTMVIAFHGQTSASRDDR
jgi:O-antigen ligase